MLYKNRSSENETIISTSVNCENFVEAECSVSSQIDFPKYSLREKIQNWYIELWPILLKIVNLHEKVKPFPIGIYVGLTGPKCVKYFFKDFVDEVFSHNGESFLNDKKIKTSFRCWSCDTPYIRQMKSLLAGNAERNLHEIFGQNIIMNFSVDGSFGKKRLREYSNVFKAIIDVISSFNENSDKTLRAAFQRQKKKYFKRMGHSKTKNAENREEDDSCKED